MAKLRFVTKLALAAALAAGPAKADAQVLVSGTFTGGSNFATTMTGTLTALAGGILQLDITNVGSGFGEVFAAIGIINVPAGSVTQGTASSNWTWEGTQQLTGDGLPETIWAWTAISPPPKTGLQPGQTERFTFNIGSITPLTNIGFGVHAISGPQGCSTKFGVWNGGSSTNDAVSNGGSYSCGVTVPEPESAMLLLTGLIGLGFVAARRRREA